MTTMYTATPRTASKYLERAIIAKLVPNLISSPGMGKSSIVKQLAARLGLEVIDHRMSTSDPTDMSGLPFRTQDDKRATFLPYDIFPLEGDPIPAGKQGWLVFLDEFNAAPRAVQAAAYKLILDRQIGQHQMHPNVVVVTAGNLSTDRAIVTDLGTAMQSRVCTIQMVVDYDEWLEDVALPNNYDIRGIAFITANRDMLHSFRPDHTEFTFPCPRTWEFVDRLNKVTPVDEMVEFTGLYAGCVGDGAAAAFVQFSQVFSNLPKVADIIKDPIGTICPYDGATRWATVTSMVGAVDTKTFTNLSVYVQRMDLEFQILFYRMALAKCPDVRTTPGFAQAAVALSQYLNGGGTI